VMSKKTKETEQAARQCGKTVLLMRTLTKTVIMPPPDPKAAERAKRYIWSRTKQAGADDLWADWRAE